MKRRTVCTLTALCGFLIGLFLSTIHQFPVQAQQVPSSLSLGTQAPTGITQGSASACSTCSGGGQSVFYYVIVRYPSGLAFPVNGIITARNTAGVGNLSNTNFNVVTWGGVSGATGYDVIRQSTPGAPTSPCTGCAVVLNTSATSVNDTGQNGGNYPPNLPSVQNVQGIFSIDNMSQLVPLLKYAMTGAPGYSVGMVLGTPTAGQSAVFNSDGSMSGSTGGGGSVTSIATTPPILGGPITNTGTISADTTVLAQKFFGTTTPGSVAGNLPGDTYVNTTANVAYYCGKVAGTPAPACTAVGVGNWTVNGTGSVTSITATAPLTGGVITTTGSVGADTTILSQKFFGTAPPGSVAGNLPGDTFSDTTNHLDYWCNAVAGTPAPACTSVTTGGWTQTNTAAPGFVLVEEHTASASASISFTTCISSTYDTYHVEMVQLVPSTNSVSLLFRASGDSGSNYAWSGFRVSRTGSAATGSDSGTSIDLTVGDTISSTAAAAGLSGSFTLYNPGGGAASSRIVGQTGYNNGGSPQQIMGTFSGVYSPTTAVANFQLLMSSGNIASGTARCYGLTK